MIKIGNVAIVKLTNNFFPMLALSELEKELRICKISSLK